MDLRVTMGVDLGGTNLKAAVVDRSGKILAQENQNASGLTPDAAITEIASLADRLLSSASLDQSSLVAVGLGSPGPLSHDTGRIIRAANLTDWVDVPIVDVLSKRLHLPVVLENDGNAAAFGEFWVGAGQDGGDLVMLTLGTGVGAGVVLDGRVLRGDFENAAELGHTIVFPDGLSCACGQKGCLEQYASGSGIVRRVKDAIGNGEASTLSAAARAGELIDAEQVANEARDGDALCVRIFDEACKFLAVACVNIQHTFNPARIVLGGGLSNAGPFLLDPIVQHAHEMTWSLHNDLPSIAIAKLGCNAGMVGVAGLAWQSTK